MNTNFIDQKLDPIREKITNSSLIAFSILGTIGQIIATLRIFYTDWSLVFVFQWIIPIILIVTTFFRKKLNVEIKVYIIMLALFLLMISGTYRFGLLATAKMYLFLIPIFAAFLLKKDKAIFFFSIVIALFLGMGLLFTLGLIDFTIDARAFAMNYISWILYAFGISVITGISYFFIRTVIQEFSAEIIDLNSTYSTLLEKENSLEQKNKEYAQLNKNLEEKNKSISEKNIQLKEAKKKAEEGEKLKSSFLQNLSHEIRSPMNGIIGFTEFLQEDNLTEQKRKEYAQIISDSSNRLLRMVNDVLDIARLETNQWPIEKTEFDLNKLLSDIKNGFHENAEKKPIELKLKTSLNGSKAIIFADKEKINQILNNLLSNAFKFTNKGHILFGYTLQENELQFYVLDTGIGIDASKQFTIFESFKKADSSVDQEYAGSGLGLAISKGIAKLLGGRIWYESGHGAGTIFYFTIPYEQTENKLSENNETIDLDISNKNILIVDDEEINLAFLKTLLKRIGANIYFATNGQDAIDICQLNKQIDLVFMDIKMPVLNGLEATKQIKSFWPTLPIIAQTAYASDDDRQNNLDWRFDDFISKPIRKQELYKKIKKFL